MPANNVEAKCRNIMCSAPASWWINQATYYCFAHYLEYKYIKARDKRREEYVPRPRKQRVVKPCGTPAAAKRHRTNNETPCDDCLASERARYAERKGVRKRG